MIRNRVPSEASLKNRTIDSVDWSERISLVAGESAFGEEGRVWFDTLLLRSGKMSGKRICENLGKRIKRSAVGISHEGVTVNLSVNLESPGNRRWFNGF